MRLDGRCGSLTPSRSCPRRSRRTWTACATCAPAGGRAREPYSYQAADRGSARENRGTSHALKARIRTELPGPNARALIERDRAVTTPSYRATIRSSWRKAAAPKSGMSMATAFSISRLASRCAAPGTPHPRVVAAIKEAARRFSAHLERLLARAHDDSWRKNQRAGSDARTCTDPRCARAVPNRLKAR